MMLGAVYFLIGEAMTKQQKLFFDRFGFAHPTSSAEIKILQKAIDEKLREYAREFCCAREAKKEFTKNTAPIEGCKIIDAREDLRALQTDICDTEYDFWSARHAAGIFGFIVKAEIEDYFDSILN